MPTRKAPSSTAQEPSGAPKLTPGGPATVLPAVRASGAVALPPELAAELAADAKDAAALERPSVAKMSFRNGTMTYLGAEMPDNKVDMILLATAFRNTYYDKPFNQDVLVNPKCFAISSDGEDMTPHENVAEPEAEKCADCEYSKWNSDPRPGSRGKACKETRRIIAIPKDAISSAAAVKEAEMAVFDVPVTSVRNYGNYVNQLSAGLNRPMWSVITTVEVKKDQKTQFKVFFTPIDVVNDSSVLLAIKARLDDAKRIVMIPFDESSVEEEAPPPKNTKIASKVQGKAGTAARR